MPKWPRCGRPANGGSDRQGFCGAAFRSWQGVRRSREHGPSVRSLPNRERFAPPARVVRNRALRTTVREAPERVAAPAARPAAARSPAAQPRPIFVVGLPRSDSTLIDQILASHSQVQGTMELPQVLGYVREREREGYPGCIARMTAPELAALGRRYLADTEPYRGDAPYFVDKMPNNFRYLGLIAAMLPEAIFVHSRRHPMVCCFSIYKQNFARGQVFGYGLDTLAVYYRNYVAMMRHWQSVLPGRVHRVVYERMVDRYGRRDTSSAGALRIVLRAGLPALFRDRQGRPNGQRRTGPTADLRQCEIALAAIRNPPCAASLESWRCLGGVGQIVTAPCRTRLFPLRASTGKLHPTFRY